MIMRGLFLTLAALLSCAGNAQADEITLYSGRGETLVAPLIEMFEKDSGIKVNIRYGDTAALAVLIQEEGANSPADLYWAQDAGALGALAKAGLLSNLPESLTSGLAPLYKSASGLWVATSGRARTLAYSPARAPEAEHPQSVFELSDERYKSRTGWAPTNGSFQAFVTGMRQMHGDDKTKDWLLAMQKNGARPYSNNTALLQAIANGEIDYALVNNYYLPRFKAKDENFPVAQTRFADKDAGNMMNIAGAAIPKFSDKKEQAQAFIAFLLSADAQEFFITETYEYSVNAQVRDDILTSSPDIVPDDLDNLEGTLGLLREAGLL
jgi:iron(III) transport system substrate-binding protein